MQRDRLSRRDFMRTGLGAASVTLAGRSFLLDAQTVPDTQTPVPPSDRVRFGMIGVGMQGSGLMNTSIHLPGVDCVAACDLYNGRLELAKQIAGKPIVTTRRYQELLDNKEIDCIIAAVPDHWHKQIVVDCCSAGKDVYCEKPMTHTVNEGFEMIAAEQKNNRIVQIGSQRRSSIIYAKARELYQSGAIGEVSLVEATMGRNDPCGAWEYTVPRDLSPQTLDWDTWLGVAPKRAFDPIRWTRWRCYQDYGEGIPGDLFVHLLTGIHTIAGIVAPPERALSSGGLFRWKDGRDVPDVMTTLYDYPKFRATIRVTLTTFAPEVTRFMGSHGVLEIHDGGVNISPQSGVEYGPCTPGWPKPVRDQYAEKWHAEHDPTVGTARTLESTNYFASPGYGEGREHLWNFFQSVRTRRPSVEDATFGNNTAIACHMANYSYFNKTVALWDPVQRKIRG